MVRYILFHLNQREKNIISTSTVYISEG